MLQAVQVTGMIAADIRTSLRLGGFFSLTDSIASQMVAKKQQLNVSCVKCNSQEVFCCASMRTLGEREVIRFCAHVCFNCGNSSAVDIEREWHPNAAQPIRCAYCDRVVTLAA